VRSLFRICTIILFAAIASRLPASPGPDTRHELVPFDLDANGRLSADELRAYLLAHGTDAAHVEDAVNDILTAPAGCENGCADIGIDVAARVIDAIAVRQAKPRDPAVGWHGLKFKRSVTDAADPRQAKSDFPAIFSYKHDKEVDDRNQFNFLGSVEFYQFTRSSGDPKTLPNSFIAVPGVELDVDGSKKKNENSIDFVMPLTWSWVFPPKAKIESLALSIAPKVETDRGFDRRVYDITTTVSAASERVGRAGFRTNVPSAPSPPRLSFYWVPSFFSENGRVADPAGNAKLEALRGNYSRLGVQLQATLQPVFIDPRLTFGLRSFYRRDLTHHENREYAELTGMFDLNTSGSLALTAGYRRGRKPPAFEMNNAVIIGIGIKQ
jgi:hypothetical protein